MGNVSGKIDKTQGSHFELRKLIVPECVYGPGALALAGGCAKSLAATKILIVTDPGVQAAGWTAKVEKSVQEAGLPYVVFNGVTANPKDYEVMAGVEVYKREGCDLILSIGGGSPTDCAKGIGISVANNKNILEFEGIDAVPEPGPPLICVPTTAGAAADMSQFAIINNSQRKTKIAIISKMAVPDASLVDPLTTMTMPTSLTLATGMDVLSHAFESYVSALNSPLTDLHALKAAELVSRNLLGAVAEPDNMAYRDGMMTACMFAGIAFSNAGLGLVHAMSHSLGGALDLAHGDCNAVLLQHVIPFNYPAASTRYAQLAKAIGAVADEKADVLQALIGWLKEFRRSLGKASGLGDMGVTAANIEQLARNASEDACIATNPQTPTLADITSIYEAAL